MRPPGGTEEVALPVNGTTTYYFVAYTDELALKPLYTWTLLLSGQHTWISTV